MGLYLPRWGTALTWVFLSLIGLLTGVVAFIVSFGVSGILLARSLLVAWILDEPTPARVSALYVVFNLACALVGGALVMFVSKPAAGSGIPQIYGYLNGVDAPDFFTLPTAVVKTIASILAVAGGLAIGKEGPLLHIGSIIAHFLGRTSIFRRLKQAKEKEPFMAEMHMRDLVACGAAAGLAAGFKAPIGGMLFALEMSTRWRAELTWRCLYACAVTAWVVRSLTRLCTGDRDFLNWGSLMFYEVSFQSPYDQLPLVAILGICGGLLGSMFTIITTYFGAKRTRILNNRWARIHEVAIISVATSSLALILPKLGRCIPCPEVEGQCFSGSERLNRFAMYQCDEGNYNDLAALMFNSQGYTLHSLFTAESFSFSALSTLLFTAFYFFLASVTYGSALPTGLFTPSLIFGASFGRLFAHVLSYAGLPEVDFGLYAFLGAASVLSGMFRFAVSFCVILLELLSAEKQLPLLMLAMVFAKGIGDRFNGSILYHLCMIMGIPLVGSHPESTIRRKGFQAKDVMTRQQDLSIFEPMEEAAAVRQALDRHACGAFPVVKRGGEPGQHQTADFLGMVEAKDAQRLLAGREEEDLVDLTSIIQAAPIVIPTTMPLTTVFKLYNTTGVKYLPVMEGHHTLKGMVSRRELVECQSVLDPHIDERGRQSFTTIRRSLSGTAGRLALGMDLLPEISSPLLCNLDGDGSHDSECHDAGANQA